MQLHLFGAQTSSGQSFKYQLSSASSSFPLIAYSRRDPSLFPADLCDPSSFRPGGDNAVPGLWISFAPIWLFAPFLEQLALEQPHLLHGLTGVIACSSSSAITKRFASNRFDRELVARLTKAEDQLLSTCQRLEVPCRILRPTLIYGRVGPYVDRNLSRLIRLMRRLKLFPVPAQTGLRQPIHASQLAAVVLDLVHQFTSTGCDPSLPERISLGGDSEITYSDMLLALQKSLPHSDPARRCLLIHVPNCIFYSAAAPLLLLSPKNFEAVLRIGSDLSGFLPVHKLLKGNPQPFPLHPLL